MRAIKLKKILLILVIFGMCGFLVGCGTGPGTGAGEASTPDIPENIEDILGPDGHPLPPDQW